MISKLLGLIFICIVFMIPDKATAQETKYYGHRGARGIYPENTIIGFNHALNNGADGIEWDVVVTKDKQLLISHEPYMDAHYCLAPNGESLKDETKEDLNIFKMLLSDAQLYDAGLLSQDKFPKQENFKVNKPSVKEAFNSVHIEDKTILFEIKSESKDYGKYQPYPDEYASIIKQEVLRYDKRQQIIFMCFDSKLLNSLQRELPNFRYVYLTVLPIISVEGLLKDIAFKPYAVGSYYKTITKNTVRKFREREIKTFAWTVNDIKDAERLEKLKVDGIITDYPSIYMKNRTTK